jgi:hypothetical protein
MALDDVCKELKLDGNANAKETIAVRIIELARCGERSQRSCAIEFCARRTTRRGPPRPRPVMIESEMPTDPSGGAL